MQATEWLPSSQTVSRALKQPHVPQAQLQPPEKQKPLLQQEPVFEEQLAHGPKHTVQLSALAASGLSNPKPATAAVTATSPLKKRRRETAIAADLVTFARPFTSSSGVSMNSPLPSS